MNRTVQAIYSSVVAVGLVGCAKKDLTSQAGEYMYLPPGAIVESVQDSGAEAGAKIRFRVPSSTQTEREIREIYSLNIFPRPLYYKGITHTPPKADPVFLNDGFSVIEEKYHQELHVDPASKVYTYTNEYSE